MTDYLQWALVFLLGLLLGAIFFGGLLWTVQKGMVSKRPALLFLGSLLLRTGVVLSGFYAIGGGDWQRLLTCLIGFICARLIVSGLTRQPSQLPHTGRTGGQHAP